MQGWSAATLTPNHNEFLRLAEAVGVKVDEKDPTASLPEVLADGRREQRAAKGNLCQSG